MNQQTIRYTSRKDESKAFAKALETGRVIVRRVMPNANGRMGQLTVQFAQKIRVPQVNGSNALVAFAQGIEEAGTNRVTALLSFSTDQAEKVGIEVKDYFATDHVIFADDLFRTAEGDINIQVHENLKIRSWVDRMTGEVVESTRQEPKQMPNPGGNDVLLYNGKPIYRHTELVQGHPDPIMPEGVDPNDVEVLGISTFIPHNGQVALAQWQSDAAKVSLEVELKGDDALSF